jgi:hypothetical protein
VLDRESTFADPEIVRMLKTHFIPVAIDQAYQRRQKDTEGDFYRKIASQGPRGNFNSTTQGFYIATASGKLLLYNNNRNPERVRRLMAEKLAQFIKLDASDRQGKSIEATKVDQRFNPTPPEGGLVIRVRAKVLNGYEPTTDKWRRIFQTSMSRDNLWVSKAEHQALVRGEFPDSLQQRIARFHLVDNTRGEPPFWNEKDVQKVQFTATSGRLKGEAHLETANHQRGYEATINGIVEVKDETVVRFDAVVLGEFWGSGRYTSEPPKGRFPLAISFTLADGSDVADKIPPQASRGWVRGYIR